MRPLRSLRVRLIAVFATVVATAMGVLFLYVVPSLRANLISDRQNRLEAVARHQKHNGQVITLFREGKVRRAMLKLAGLANAQVSAFQIDPQGRLSRDPKLSAYPPSVAKQNPIITSAIETGGPVAGRTPSGSVIVAFPMPNHVVMLTQRVGDVNDTAALVERQFLIATVLALLVAGLVGWAAAVAISQRLSRLELAAARVAEGRFDQPIGDTTPDELGRLARAFDLMQRELGQVDRARKDFIANASHELRTPLFSLGGFLELMENEDLDDATREEFLLTMREQVRRLTKLASDLLDLSRLDAGAVEIEREPIDLGGTARTLVREFRGLAAKHGSRVVLTRDGNLAPRAIGDEQRVQQIGRVLVDNAIRHTPTGTEVRVGVSGDNGRVRLSVVDDGPGIDDGARERLFQRFARGEQATAAGSGLGLAIARELAQRMDGSLDVESRPGRTEFALELPVEREPD
ncbi:MAG: sensor histidine kinase [Gaiellales bacterium]